MKKVLFFIALSGSSIFCSPSIHQKKHQQKVLVADLGGIVFEYSKIRYVYYLGIGNLLGYLVHGKNPEKLGDVIFHVLEQAAIEEDPTLTRTCTKKGEPLPYLLNAYQAGKVSHEQALQLALESFEKLSTERFFSNDQEKELVKNALNVVFNPEVYAETIVSLHGGVTLLREIAEQEYEDKTKKVRLIGLTN